MNFIAIGKTITCIRKNKSVSQGNLAKKVEISQTYISQIEKGHKEPSLKVLNKIALILEIPLSYIFFLSITEHEISKEKIIVWKSVTPSIKNLVKAIFPEELNGL